MKLVIIIFCILFANYSCSNFNKYSEFTKANVNIDFQPDTGKQKNVCCPIIPRYEGKQEYFEATFPDGEDALAKFIELNIDTNVVIPNEYYDSSSNYLPSVAVEFIVTSDGKTKNFKTFMSIYGCPECDKEALRIARLMPNWLPAHKIDTNTNAVIKYYSEERVISIKFKYATK